LTDRKRIRLAAEGSLVLVTVVWGTTFVVVKVAVESVDPLAFVALRFGLAALVLLVVCWPRVRGAPAGTWVAGGWLGIALLAGFLFQTFGLRETTPARGGFITGLSVVLVPLLDAALTRRWPGRAAGLGVVLSTLGLVLLSAPLDPSELAGGSWRGDLLVLGCAFAFALHIVGVGHFAGRYDACAISAVQIAVVGLLAGAAALILGGQLPSNANVWLAVAYMGPIATALVFLIQNWAQIHTSSTHTALIFALEPVFAALFSLLLYGEQLGPRTLVGGALILAGMLVAELSGLVASTR
jgi:drug/metabolite transporter (DMT)-like permease